MANEALCSHLMYVFGRGSSCLMGKFAVACSVSAMLK